MKIPSFHGNWVEAGRKFEGSRTKSKHRPLCLGQNGLPESTYESDPLLTHVWSTTWPESKSDAFLRLLGHRMGQNSICQNNGLDSLPFAVLPTLNRVSVGKVSTRSTTSPFSGIFSWFLSSLGCWFWSMSSQNKNSPKTKTFSKMSKQKF